jgi:hypothetical protein
MMDETSGGERCGSKRPGFFFLFERKKHQAAGFFLYLIYHDFAKIYGPAQI